MDIQEYRAEIKDKLTGGVLECELEDAVIDRLINSALREIRRYVDLTKVITIPYKACLDLSEYNVISVARVYRAESYNGNNTQSASDFYTTDPMNATQWQLMTAPANITNITSYAYNFAAYNSLLQVRNSTSTDLSYFYDDNQQKLYVNTSSGMPGRITIEYVPFTLDVSEIKSPFWVDLLLRLSLAIAKETLGTVYSRYTQGNALWGINGTQMLEDGKMN